MIRNARLLLIVALCGCSALAAVFVSLALMSYVQILYFVPTAAVAGVALTAGTLLIILVLAAGPMPRIKSLARPVILIGVAVLVGFFVGVYNLLFPSWLIPPLALAFTTIVIVLALPPGRMIGPRRAGLLALAASVLLLTPSFFFIRTLLSGYFTNPVVVRGLYATVFIAAMFGTLYPFAMAAVFIGWLRKMPPVRASPAAA